MLGHVLVNEDEWNIEGEGWENEHRQLSSSNMQELKPDLVGLTSPPLCRNDGSRIIASKFRNKMS